MSEAKSLSLVGGSVILCLFCLLCLVRCIFTPESFIYANKFRYFLFLSAKLVIIKGLSTLITQDKNNGYPYNWVIVER